MATQVLNDGDGFRWDIIDVYPFTNTVGTAVLDGTYDYFDGGFTLRINGVTFAGSFLRSELAGRQLVLADDIGSLSVTRKVYVPETSGVGFARFLETVTNTARTAVTVSFQIQSNSGNDGDFRTASTSSGDASFAADDVWVVNTDTPNPIDSDGEAVLHLFGDGSVAPTSAGTTVFDASTTNGITYTFQSTIVPGASASFLHFGSQQINSNAAMAGISQIQVGDVGSDLTPQALFGLTDAELFQTFNFELQIRYDGTLGDDLIVANSVAPFFGASNLINGLPGNDVIYGNEGNDAINGNQGSDVVNGNQGDDLVQGGQDNDIVNGGQGNDDVRGDLGDDTTYGDLGNDTVSGGVGNDSVNGNAGNDTVNGNQGSDTVSGGQGNDFVQGGQGADVVYGDLGNDTLSGDLGNDILTGGAGADVFVFAAGSGNDVITDFDFAAGDRLDFGDRNYSAEAGPNGSTEISFMDGSTIILQGVTSDEFNASFVA